MANEISTSVLVNEQEARAGAVLELPLPDGRSTSVTIPAGVRNGQVLQFPAHIPPVQEGEQPDTLIVTVYVEQQDEQTEAVTSPLSGDQAPAAGAPSYPGEQPFSATTSVPPGYPPLPSQAAFPPQGGYPYAPTAQPPQRKKHIVRNVIIIASILVIIFVACAGLLVFAVKQQIDKSQSFVVTQIAGNKTKVAQTRVNATQVVQTVVAGTTTAVAANPNPYLSGQGTFLVQDKLDGSDTPSPLLKGPAGEYRDGAFHIVSVVKDMIVSCPLINTPEPDGSRVLYPQYKNFTAEFKMTIVQGDTGGIHFRISGRQAYRLIFDSMGRYQLNADQGGKLTSLSHGASAAFHQGLNQENTIGLAVDGHSILWFVNGQPVGAVNDSTFGDAGGISLEAGSYVGHTYATEVAFRDFRLWALNS